MSKSVLRILDLDPFVVKIINLLVSVNTAADFFFKEKIGQVTYFKKMICYVSENVVIDFTKKNFLTSHHHQHFLKNNKLKIKIH